MIAITKKDIVDMVVEEDPPIKENGWDGATSKNQLFDFHPLESRYLYGLHSHP